VTETEINLPFITANARGPKHLQMKLTRAQLEQPSEGLMARLRGPFEAALKDAGLSASEVDEVILVGGAARMPTVRELVRSLTGKETVRVTTRKRSWRSVPPSRPACWWGSEGRSPAGRHATLAGRGNHGRGRTPLIPRNTTVPFEKPKVFSSPEDGEMTVDIHVLQASALWRRPR
jgi:molecular chaperone DnaK